MNIFPMDSKKLPLDWPTEGFYCMMAVFHVREVECWVKFILDNFYKQ